MVVELEEILERIEEYMNELVDMRNDPATDPCEIKIQEQAINELLWAVESPFDDAVIRAFKSELSWREIVTSGRKNINGAYCNVDKFLLWRKSDTDLYGYEAVVTNGVQDANVNDRSTYEATGDVVIERGQDDKFVRLIWK